MWPVLVRRPTVLEEGWVRAVRVVVRPGLFAEVGEGRDQARFQPMPDLVSAKMTPDAVVSPHSALWFFGISYLMWFDAVYSATEPALSLAFRAMRYRVFDSPSHSSTTPSKREHTLVTSWSKILVPPASEILREPIHL